MWKCPASLLVLKNTVHFRYVYMAILELHFRTNIFLKQLV